MTSGIKTKIDHDHLMIDRQIFIHVDSGLQEPKTRTHEEIKIGNCLTIDKTSAF